MSQTTTYADPLIIPDQPLSVPSHKVFYMIEKTVTKVIQSQFQLDIEFIDAQLSFLHDQLDLYIQQGNSQEQSDTETEIDQYNTWRTHIQTNLDELSYTETGVEEGD